MMVVVARLIANGHVVREITDADVAARVPVVKVERSEPPVETVVETPTFHDEGSIDTMAEARKPARGELTQFIRDNADFSTPEGITEEGKRLLALAEKEGLSTTIGSLLQGIRVQRKQRKAAPGAVAPERKRAASRAKERKSKRSGRKQRQTQEHRSASTAGVQFGSNLLALVDAADNSLKLLRAGVLDFQRQHQDFAKVRDTLNALIKGS